MTSLIKHRSTGATHPNIPDGQSTRPHHLYQLDLAGPEPKSEHQ
jgi:hypothetical protein